MFVMRLSRCCSSWDGSYPSGFHNKFARTYFTQSQELTSIYSHIQNIKAYQKRTKIKQYMKEETHTSYAAFIRACRSHFCHSNADNICAYNSVPKYHHQTGKAVSGKLVWYKFYSFLHSTFKYVSQVHLHEWVKRNVQLLNVKRDSFRVFLL